MDNKDAMKDFMDALTSVNDYEIQPPVSLDSFQEAQSEVYAHLQLIADSLSQMNEDQKRMEAKQDKADKVQHWILAIGAASLLIALIPILKGLFV